MKKTRVYGVLGLLASVAVAVPNDMGQSSLDNWRKTVSTNDFLELEKGWWDIEWRFRVGNSTFKTFKTVRQDYRAIGSATNGTFRITKGASGAEISTGELAHFFTP